MIHLRLSLVMSQILMLGLVFLCLSIAAAEPMDSVRQGALLTEANKLFDEGNAMAASDPDGAKALYEKSILRYERLVKEGGVCNGKLHYNLANAYFLAGDIGPAILNYRRAEQYIPNDPNLHQNIDYVRNQRLDKIEDPQKTKVLKTLFFWHYDLASKTRMVLFAASFAFLWLCASIRLFRTRTALGWCIAMAAVLSMLLAGSLSVEAVAQIQDASGVIVADEVVARKGNGETYQPSFEEALHAGSEFSIVEERAGWYHISLRDGRGCWIPATAAERVRQAR